MRVINRVATLSKPQTRYIPIGLSPSGLQCVCVSFTRGGCSVSSASLLLLLPKGTRWRYSNVPASRSYAGAAARPPLVPLSPLSLAATPSHLHLARVQLCGTERCVRLPVGHPQHQQHKRGRSSLPQRRSPGGTALREEKKGGGIIIFCLFSSTSFVFFCCWLLSIFTTLLTLSLYPTSHFSLTCSDLLLHPSQMCMCVCARRKWAGTCNLIRFEMRKRRCQQATLPVIVILLKTPNDANQCSAICSSSLTICEQSKGQILCSPCAF